MHPTDAVPAFDLRISIEGTEPEIWRRLQFPETITVPEFHRVLQAAFGWENRHLYGIRCTDLRGEGRIVIGPDEAVEDSYAEPASGVALVELLDAHGTGPADFQYEYDFGDAWTHTVELMGPGRASKKALRCTGGANRGPVEDSGGSHGYRRIIEVLGDPGHPEYEDTAGWYKFATGQDATTFAPTVLDASALNARLDELALQLWPEPPTDGEIDAVVHAVHWFLSQVPADGLPLTKDGYLKPAFVRETFEALGLAEQMARQSQPRGPDSARPATPGAAAGLETAPEVQGAAAALARRSQNVRRRPAPLGLPRQRRRQPSGGSDSHGERPPGAVVARRHHAALG